MYYFLACAQYSATPLSVLECARRCEGGGRAVQGRVFGVGRDCQVPFMCQLLWLLSQNASFGEMLLAFWHVAYVVRACLECVRCQSAVSFVSVWGARKSGALRHCTYALWARNEESQMNRKRRREKTGWGCALINIDAALTMCSISGPLIKCD